MDIPPPISSQPSCPQQQHIDHGTAVDVATVVLVGICAVPFIAANIILVCHRNWRPIATKHVPFTVLSSLAGLFWIFATIITLNTFPRGRRGDGDRAGFLTLCQLFTFWLQLALGSCLWVNCINVQLYRLCCLVFSRAVPEPLEQAGCWDSVKQKWIPALFPLPERGEHRQRVANRRLWVFLAVLELPIVLLSLAALAAKPSVWDGCRNDCILLDTSHLTGTTLAFQGLVWVLLVFYFGVWGFFAWSLRDLNKRISEYRQAVIAGSLGFLLFIMAIVIRLTKSYYHPEGRTPITLAVATIVYVYFGVRCGPVVYHVLVDKERFLEQEAQGLQVEDLIDNRGTSRRPHRQEAQIASTVAIDGQEAPKSEASVTEVVSGVRPLAPEQADDTGSTKEVPGDVENGRRDG